MTQRTRWMVYVVGGLLVWFAMITAFWAVRTLSDAVPVGAKDGVPVSQTVHCNSLFSSSARADTPLPTPTAPLAYTREACTVVHRQARVLFALDLAVVIVGLLGVGAFALRSRQTADRLLRSAGVGQA